MPGTLPVGSQLDLQKIPVKGLVVENAAGASPPASPVEGQMYVDTTAHRVKVYENGSWVTASNSDTLDLVPLAAAAVSLNGQKITSLGTPTAPTDGVNKAYSDAGDAAIAIISTPVACVINTLGDAPSAFSGYSANSGPDATITGGIPLTMEGVTLTVGMRVLIAFTGGGGYGIGGIWVVTAIPSGTSINMARATDFQTAPLTKNGYLVQVNPGGTPGQRIYMSTPTATPQNAFTLMARLNPESTTQKGVANGYAGLGVSGKVPAAQLPTLDVIPTAANDVSLGAFKITNVGAPVNSSDAIRLMDVDYRYSKYCRFLSTSSAWTLNGSNQVTNGTSTVDSFAVSVGDRILLINNGAVNLPYKVQTVGTGTNGLWVPDFGNTDFGSMVSITGGFVYGGSTWMATGSSGSITWVKTSLALGFTAGTAMQATTVLNNIPVATGPVSLNGQRITSVATPTAGTDAVNKDYVDAIAAGLDPKASARAAQSGLGGGSYATTGGLNSAGQLTNMPSTLDSTVALVANDRVVILDNGSGAAAPYVGLWVVTTVGTGANGVWNRPTDYITNRVSSGAFTFVEEGTIFKDKGYTLVTDGAITVDTGGGTSMLFTQFSSAGSYVGTANRVTISGGAIDIAATYVGQTSITTLGTVTTGTWTGTTIAVANGGTGAIAAPAARANLGATGKYTATVTTVANVELVVTHGLGTTAIGFPMFTDSSGNAILAAFRVISSNTIGITTGVAYASAVITVVG